MVPPPAGVCAPYSFSRVHAPFFDPRRVIARPSLSSSSARDKKRDGGMGGRSRIRARRMNGKKMSRFSGLTLKSVAFLRLKLFHIR